MLPLPSIMLGLIISSLLGAAFHLWKGGGPGRLILDLLLGWLGFWFGQFIASRLQINLFNLGSLHLGPALLMGFIFLLVGNWLSGGEPERRPRGRK